MPRPYKFSLIEARRIVDLYDKTEVLLTGLMERFHCSRKTLLRLFTGRMYTELHSEYFDGHKLWRKG